MKIIFLITLLILSIIIFAAYDIVSMKSGIQKEINAFGTMLKINDNKPEEIAAQLDMLRSTRENEKGNSIIQLISIIILGITAGILLWYSAETKRLADLTAKQIKINIKPIIIVNSIISHCSLRNIGKSPALNIKVKDVVRIDNTSNKKYIFKFTEIPVCGSEEARGTSITPHYNGKPIIASGEADSIKTHFLDYGSLSEGQNYELITDYEDIEGGKWRSVSIVDKLGVHFKEVKELAR